jgi:hypothetical protein
MEDVQIIFSALWVALMLTYLLGVMAALVAIAIYTILIGPDAAAVRAAIMGGPVLRYADPADLWRFRLHAMVSAIKPSSAFAVLGCSPCWSGGLLLPHLMDVSI